MRDTASRKTKRSTLWVAAAALPCALTLGATIIPTTSDAQSSGKSNSVSDVVTGSTDYLQNQPTGTRTSVRTDRPVVEGLPEGVSIDRVEWFSNRRISIFINSAVMPEKPIQVQVLLARDWHSNRIAKFPSVWALDGLRALDSESGWTINTNIEQFYADKNVNVILPVGGKSSFYADWLEEDQGKNYKWESFLIDELIPVLKNGWRDSGDRAVVGLSMGGTAAVNLAERNPDLFKFVGSFSGYLDTTSVGMPQAIMAAQQEVGGFNSVKMWGKPGSQQWIDHDPKLGVKNLKDMVVYVSAGSGRDDYGQANSVAKGPANLAGSGLEVISRMTTDTFVQYAKKANVDVTAKFRPSGVHDWPYWQFEMTRAWPYIADALGLAERDRSANCAPIGAIADAQKNSALGNCVNDEYDVAGGKVQDFYNGRAYWSADTGAFGLYGRINARYSEIGGPSSWLGFPTSEERPLANGGRFVTFENGNIYWSPSTGAWEVPKAVMKGWGDLKWENGSLGYPVGAPRDLSGGQVQQFQGGYVVTNKDGKANWVRGEIAKKYGELKLMESALGFPVGNEKLIKGGAFQEFQNGYIYWSAKTGAHLIKKGDIFEAWGKKGYEQGEFGFPTADQASIPAGGEVVEFERGLIRQVNGVIQEEKK